MSRKLRILLLVVGLGFPLDQLCKRWVELQLAPGDRLPLIDGFLYITHARNPGAAFGLFAASPGDWRLLGFAAVSVVAIGVIVAFFTRLAPGDRIQSFGLGFVLAGALGNFLDRILRGEVVDFIHVRLWEGYAWPDFNLADAFIVMGVGSLMIDLLSREATARAA